MTDYTKEWGNVYNKAETIFHRDINAVKKTEKTIGAFLDDEFKPIRKPVGLLAALVAIDKIDLSDVKNLAASVKLFKPALAKLDGEVTKLVKLVVAAQKLQPSMKDKNGLVVPNPIKTWLPDSFRQLKLLETEAKAIVARAANDLKGALNKAEATKIEEAKNKAKDKVKGSSEADNAALKAISEEAAMKQFVLQFATSFKSSMAKGAAVIQRIKASPDAATYNKEMDKGGRDISQNLVNIVKLQSNKALQKSSLAKKLPPPGKLATDIKPFGDGNKRRIDQAATPAQVKELLAEFSQLYKKIALTYADVLKGKLS